MRKIIQRVDNKQNGSAKTIIIGILLFSIIAVVLAILLTSSMSDIASKQLKNIQAGDLDKAYSLTSKLYQDQVSFANFTTYVEKNPILKNHLPVKFTNRKIDGITGYISGKIQGPDHHPQLLEYAFIKEHKHWKINDIRLSAIDPLVVDTTSVSDSSGASIHGILISDSADKDGFVDIEKLEISKTASRIYATVQIVAPSGGTTISIILTTASGQKMGPLTINVPKAGDVIKAFYFSKPMPAWTPGDYSVTASLPTGATQTLKFKVR